jgi:hypothetical protein
MASSIGGLGLSSIIHADSESALLAPCRAPAVSSYPELFAPATLNSVLRRLTISDKSNLMINMLLIAAATQIFLKEDTAFIVTESICNNDADSHWLLGNHILQLPVGHVSSLNKASIFEDSLGLIVKTSCTLQSSVWIVSLWHQTILRSVSVSFRGPSTLAAIISDITINQLLSRKRSFILTANCMESLHRSDSGKSPRCTALRVGELIFNVSHDSFFLPILTLRSLPLELIVKNWNLFSSS